MIFAGALDSCCSLPAQRRGVIDALLTGNGWPVARRTTYSEFQKQLSELAQLKRKLLDDKERDVTARMSSCSLLTSAS